METEERVKQSLSVIKQQLGAHGGGVEFVSMGPDNVVTLKLTGACGGCPMATQTLKHVVEKHLKKQVPEIQGVKQA